MLIYFHPSSHHQYSNLLVFSSPPPPLPHHHHHSDLIYSSTPPPLPPYHSVTWFPAVLVLVLSFPYLFYQNLRTYLFVNKQHIWQYWDRADILFFHCYKLILMSEFFLSFLFFKDLFAFNFCLNLNPSFLNIFYENMAAFCANGVILEILFVELPLNYFDCTRQTYTTTSSFVNVIHLYTFVTRFL